MSISDFNMHFIWGIPTVCIFLFVGIYFTVKLKFFQFHIKNFLKSITEKSIDTKKALTPRQALTATIAFTIGTGNIAAIGTAIAIGGAGTIFWLWVAAFVGMATTYAENFLGVKYRCVSKEGKIKSGAFYYIEKALGGKVAKIFALFALLAGLGKGNMAQSSVAATSLKTAFGTPVIFTGIVIVLVLIFLYIGGTKLFGEITEKWIPIMSFIYIAGATSIIIIFHKNLPIVFLEIFKEAFSLKSVSGGIFGIGMIKTLSWGAKRSIFSNEAGMGSNVFWGSKAENITPEKAGTLASFAVFFDSIVICTLTGLVILLGAGELSGVEYSDTTSLAARSFGVVYGEAAEGFICICMVLFALTTLYGWGVFVKACGEYLFGKGGIFFSVIYIVCAFFGAVVGAEIIFELADTWSGLMALPNLFALLVLRKQIVTKINKKDNFVKT